MLLQTELCPVLSCAAQGTQAQQRVEWWRHTSTETLVHSGRLILRTRGEVTEDTKPAIEPAGYRSARGDLAERDRRPSRGGSTCACRLPGKIDGRGKGNEDLLWLSPTHLAAGLLGAFNQG